MAGAAWAEHPDFENRDPENISDGLAVAVSDVIAEPDHTQSSECAWSCAYRCFRLWKLLCYSIFTTLCGWACGCGWGCWFAGVAVYYVWCLNPFMRTFSICIEGFRRCNTAIAEACIAPMCAAFGRVFDAFRK